MRFIIIVLILLQFLLTNVVYQAFAEEKTNNLIIMVTYEDGTSVIPDVCVIYDARWQGIGRQFPSSNSCTFEDLNSGVYQIEIYKNDFLIGDSTNINMTGKDIEKTIVTKKQGALLFNVYYGDGHARFPNVTIRLYNHANTLIDAGISDERGEIGFSGLWPNNHRGEYYWAEAELNGKIMETINPINVDKDASNPYDFILKVDRPPKGIFQLDPIMDRIIFEFVVIPLVFAVAVAIVLEVFKKPIRKTWRRLRKK